MLDTEKLMQYAKLFRARQALKKKYKELTAQIKSMESVLLPHMANNQIEKCNLKGGFVVYMDTKIWPDILTTKEELIEALKESGHGDVVNETFNTNSLASWLRELNMMDEPLPEELQKHLRPNPVTTLLVKKFK